MGDGTPQEKSHLRYADSNEAVRLGDRVDLKSVILRRSRPGTVICIPELTGRERAKLKKDPEDWLIKLDSGVITGWLYSPEDLQPPRRLHLLERASGNVETISNEQLEAMERAEEESASWFELAAPLVSVLILLLVLGIWLL